MTEWQAERLDPPSYPRNGSYADLLNWHLFIWGTRPEQGFESGQEWDRKTFTDLVHSDEAIDPDSRDTNLVNWLKGIKPQRRTRREKIERALFGDNADLIEWRNDLRASFRRSDQQAPDLAVPTVKPTDVRGIPATLPEEVAAGITELVAIARSAGVFQRATEQGISEKAVRKIVERLGGDGVGRDELVAWLDGWIENARQQLDRGSNKDIAFQMACAAADMRFRAGEFSTASDPLMELLEREQAESRRRQEQVIKQAILYDMMSFNIDGVTEKEKLVARMEVGDSLQAIGNFLYDRAFDYYEAGRDHGESSAILVSVSLFRESLGDDVKDGDRLAWGERQNNLALALCELGRREGQSQRLQEAIDAFRLAIEAVSREEEPENWATMHDNLGGALALLGQREIGTGLLHEAMAEFELSLEERKREFFPLDWALTQCKIARALYQLGERSSEAEFFARAVEVSRIALGELNGDIDPKLWASAQTVLGESLMGIARETQDVDFINEAIASYRLALAKRDRDDAPMDWAETHLNLGAALFALSHFESGPVPLQEAIASLQSALGVLTRVRAPLEWAVAQNALGSAWRLLGLREDRPELLNEAIKAFRLALSEQPRESVPIEWAKTQYNLGKALLEMAKRNDEISSVEEGAAALRLSLEVLRDELDQRECRWIQRDLTIAESILDERQRRQES